MMPVASGALTLLLLASAVAVGARRFDAHSSHSVTPARPTPPCEPQRSVTKRCEREGRGALLNRVRARSSLFRYRGGAEEKVDGHCIGIDLGTTYSCVGVWKNGRVEIIANDQGNRITPSYVAWTADDQRLIGDAAKNQASANPENTVYDAKRLIGRKISDSSVQDDIKHWPFEVVDTDGKPKVVVTAGGRKQFSPEEISAMVLTKMKQVAEDYLGEGVKYAVVTVRPTHAPRRDRAPLAHWRPNGARSEPARADRPGVRRCRRTSTMRNGRRPRTRARLRGCACCA